DADLQILSLCGFAVVGAALCVECVSRTSRRQSASHSATREVARGVSAYARTADRRREAAARCGETWTLCDERQIQSARKSRRGQEKEEAKGADGSTSTCGSRPQLRLLPAAAVFLWLALASRGAAPILPAILFVILDAFGLVACLRQDMS